MKNLIDFKQFNESLFFKKKEVDTTLQDVFSVHTIKRKFTNCTIEKQNKNATLIKSTQPEGVIKFWIQNELMKPKNNIIHIPFGFNLNLLNSDLKPL